MQPNHVGLIPDGIRRWARLNHKSYLDAYQVAMQQLAGILDFLYRQEVSAISIYLLSKDNLQRTPAHLEPVLEAEMMLLLQLLPGIIEHHEVLVRHAGVPTILPTNYLSALASLCEKSNLFQKKRLYLLAAYDPLDEVMAATQSFNPTRSLIECLWVPEYVDLVIRTSNEQRLSNFLPLQSGYAEIIFSDKHFNDLSEKDYQDFVLEYTGRQRRFGR